jgi:type II secretory pathway pseudopilin PulG
MRVTQRRGSSLIELLVALPLMALLGSVAVMLLLFVARSARTQGRTLQVSRELRHAVLVLSHDIDRLRVGEVLTVSDTLLEFDARLGAAVVCDVPTSGQLVVGDVSALSPSPLNVVRAGDALSVWRTPDANSGAAMAGLPQPARTSVGTWTPIGVGPCGAAGDALRVPRWRTAVDSAWAADIVPGTPVLLQRRTRYTHYRSDGQWWLGRRALDVTGWETVQPLAGPLYSAAANGMTVLAYDQRGIATTNASEVALLHVTLRAPHTAAGRIVGPGDSAQVQLALRGAPQADAPPPMP